MGYIYGLIIVALLVTAMHYFTELTTKQKLITFVLLFAIISLAIAYNKEMQKQQEKILQLVTYYEQGKTLTCNNRDVNQSTYTLSIGTYTFIGKENTPHYAEMIDISTCTLKNKGK